MVHAQFIKYESGDGFSNKWVVGSFPSQQLKNKFMKIWTNAVSISQKNLNKKIKDYKAPLEDRSVRMFEIHTIDFVKKKGFKNKVWETKSIEIIKTEYKDEDEDQDRDE